MIYGNPSTFAIESGIMRAYARLSFRALGFFVIHVKGRQYGKAEPEATMLACSFDEVERRIACRGQHTMPLADQVGEALIAYAFRNAVYANEPDGSYFGIPRSDFCEMIYSNHLVWTPDGDEAFDDGSYVLQFDIGDSVRLIAYKSRGESYDPTTLSSVYLAADEFYHVLQTWHDAFAAEWVALPKVQMTDVP